VIPSKQIPEAIRQAQDPLADRHTREYVIHEVRRALGHPAATTGRTKAASLAGERHQAAMVARVALEAREPVGKAAAGQKLAKLAFHEAWQSFALAEGGCLRAERLEVVADDAVEHGVHRSAGLIRDGWREARPVTRRPACQRRSSRIWRESPRFQRWQFLQQHQGRTPRESRDRFVDDTRLQPTRAVITRSSIASRSATSHRGSLPHADRSCGRGGKPPLPRVNHGAGTRPKRDRNSCADGVSSR
jgi:hypothetical protein